MKENENGPVLKRIHKVGWILLAVLTLGGWLLFGLFMARSILLGGILANVSFWLLERDLTRLLKESLDGVKARFFIKYYLRLTVLALILFLLISQGLVQFIGLLIGLSTVLISITILAIGIARKTIHIREAS